MAFRIGDIIGQRYKIVEELEEGGFGKVFLAHDLLKFNAKCLVKQFIQRADDSFENNKKSRELFEEEAKILCDLEYYSQIPRLLAYLKDENCIVQDFVEGKNLEQELRDSTFDEEQILRLLYELLPILEQIHKRGIFHRDIKPANIIRDKSDKFILIDFGISKKVSELDTGRSSSSLRFAKTTNFGTPGYKSPENFSSASGDLYSLGVTCFHLLSGYQPSPETLEYNYGDEWIQRSLGRINVSRKVENILNKLLDSDIKNRYQNAQEVLQDIREIDQVRQSERLNFLQTLLQSSEESYKIQAINDLANLECTLSNTSAIPDLIDVLINDSKNHSHASNALIKIGQKATPFLANLLTHENLAVKIRAAFTLQELGVQAKSAIPQLISALNDSDDTIRWLSVVTLGKMGITAHEAKSELIKKLQDTTAEVRSWALYALGRIGSSAKDAEPMILELLQNEKDSNVFMAAFEALDAIGIDISKIQVKDDKNNISKTAKEWVFSVRKNAQKRDQELDKMFQKRDQEQYERALAKGQKILISRSRVPFRPRITFSDTPPHKDLSEFTENIFDISVNAYGSAPEDEDNKS